MAKALQGKRVLVTRARHQAAELMRLIEAAGGEPVPFPVISSADPTDWAPVDAAIADRARYRWLVLTSPNGVRQFAQRLARARVPASAMAHMKVVAVGSGTAKALAGRGFPVDLIPGEFRGAAIPLALSQKLHPGDWVLLPRGDLADPALPEALRSLGANVDEVLVYRTVPDVSGDVDALTEQLLSGQIDYVTFLSGSAVRFLVQRLGSTTPLRRSRIACIGPVTAHAAGLLGLPVHVIAQPYTAEGLLEALIRDNL